MGRSERAASASVCMGVRGCQARNAAACVWCLTLAAPSNLGAAGVPAVPSWQCRLPRTSWLVQRQAMAATLPIAACRSGLRTPRMRRWAALAGRKLVTNSARPFQRIRQRMFICAHGRRQS